MLLYESSKCTHGRPTPFRGKYYASAFIHFKPTTDWAYDNNHRVAAVPGHFNMGYDEWRREILPKLHPVAGITPGRNEEQLAAGVPKERIEAQPASWGDWLGGIAGMGAGEADL